MPCRFTGVRDHADEGVDELVGGGAQSVRAEVATELHVRDAVGAGEQQGAVAPCVPLPHEGGDDGQELLLEASGRAPAAQPDGMPP
ncbi:hypothetical protein ACWZEH_07355 [Streptomyces sp. QTS137]